MIKTLLIASLISMAGATVGSNLLLQDAGEEPVIYAAPDFSQVDVLPAPMLHELMDGELAAIPSEQAWSELAKLCNTSMAAGPCCEAGENPVSCTGRVTREIIEHFGWTLYVICKDFTSLNEATCNTIFCTIYYCVEIEECPAADELAASKELDAPVSNRPAPTTSTNPAVTTLDFAPAVQSQHP